MMNRDAPLTFFGAGLPAGSLVFLKSRLRLYSVSAIPLKINHGLRGWARGLYKRSPRHHVFQNWRLTETPVQKLRFARQRLADEVPDEATNDDVLAQFGNLGIQQVANCHIGIFDEALLEQANRAIEFLEFAVDNFVRDLRRFALHLCLVDFAFRLDEVARNIGAADVERVRGGDMQRDVFHELPEILVPRYEISLAIHLYEHTDLALKVNVGSNDTFLRRARSFVARARDPFRAQNRLRFLQIAARFLQRAFAIHHACVGFLTQFLNEFWSNLRPLTRASSCCCYLVFVET